MKFRPGFALGLATMLFGASSVFAGDCGCATATGSVVSGMVVGGGDAGCGCAAPQVSYV